MKRLDGPYGMDGTVYSVSTKVLHVAHPIPAGAILAPTRRPASIQQQQQSADEKRRISSRFLLSSASNKAPAYDHFQNFCGEGVFTADGEDWRAKRAAVMYALFRMHHGGFEAKLEKLVDMAATRLIDNIVEEQGKSRSTYLNVVPILQQVTVCLVFRHITDTDLGEALASKAAEKDDGTEQGFLFSSYRESITRIRMIILAQSRSIWFLLPRFCYRLFSSMYREEEIAMDPIRVFSRLSCNNAKEGSSLATLRQNPIYKAKEAQGV
jgi:hypothetical protein